MLSTLNLMLKELNQNIDDLSLVHKYISKITKKYQNLTIDIFLIYISNSKNLSFLSLWCPLANLNCRPIA